MFVMYQEQIKKIPFTRIRTLPEKYVKEKINFFLSEDKSNYDITTIGTISKSTKIKAEIIAQEDCIVAGSSILRYCFPNNIMVEECARDGQFLDKNKILAVCQGSAQTILSRERVILNLLQRLCGIATLTKKYTNIANSYGCKILDTRKTTPGLRLFEKYAVVAGEGYNHRLDLKSAVLIKDNHLFASGGIKNALNRLLKSKIDVPIELEVDNLEQLNEGLCYDVDGFLLDNMSPNTIRSAVDIIKHSSKNDLFLEASGGITLDKLSDYASTGVDAISVGALTTNVRNIDLKMEFKNISE